MFGPMQWFGPRPFGPICEPSQERAIPVGQMCLWCDEEIVPGDSGFLAVAIDDEVARRKAWHRECFLRTLSGSIAHVEKRCSCFGGTDPEHEPHFSKREEAQIAVRLWLRFREQP